MQTRSLSSTQLHESVIAVPPLPRDKNLVVSIEQNRRLVRYLEAGGIGTLLYGGNANFYHVSLAEYGQILDMLRTIVAESTLVIPSVGPAYGTMMSQADILKDYAFPTVMVLPQREIMTSAGLATAVRRLSDRISRPVVLYLKHDRTVDVTDIESLVRDGLVSFIKYAVVRENPSQDTYLSEITEHIPSSLIVSGIGEQPAITHMRSFGLAGFTSGCVCVAPALSMAMLHALVRHDYDTAESIRSIFQPLEDLRNAINPIRVLHEAVTAAGIAETGPHLPLLSPLTEGERAKVRTAALELKTKSIY
jgi:dihydrodipicolinate synthase/N-acetylneuraminate lyase